MKTKLTISIFLFAVLFLGAQKTRAQDGIEGSYSVGKTSCTIEWSQNDKAYKCYWNEGTGYTLIFYKEDQPNGNIVYDEYEKDGVTYTGTFTFKTDSYRSGIYSRSDGKDFSVKRKR